MINVLFSKDKFHNADDDMSNHSKKTLEYTFAPKKKIQMNIAVQLALINQRLL